MPIKSVNPYSNNVPLNPTIKAIIRDNESNRAPNPTVALSKPDATFVQAVG